VEAAKAFTCKENFIKFKLDSESFTKTIPMTSWAAIIQLLKTPESIKTEPTKTHSSRRVSWAGSIRQNRSKDAIGKDKPVAKSDENPNAEYRVLGISSTLKRLTSFCQLWRLLITTAHFLSRNI
jgi:hypothetical protein